jgi:hypothetical protein
MCSVLNIFLQRKIGRLISFMYLGNCQSWWEL